MSLRSPSSAWLLKALLGLIVVGVVCVLVFRGVDFRGLVNRALGSLRDLGPGAFFGGVALLPAVGFPLIAFSFAAAPAFSATLGLPTVAVLLVLSIAANMSLTYWLARYALRPVLERWIVKAGYKVPEVTKDDSAGLTLLVRLTPGPPFFIQNYLLGLARVPFLTYLGLSLMITGSYSLAAVFFGDALMSGNGRAIALAVSALVVITVAIRWIRKRAAARAADTRIQ